MESLLKEAKNGNNLAFTTIVLQMQTDLYNIAKSRLKNDDDTFDAIQTTIEKAYKNIKKLKNDSSFRSWIITILVNECNQIYNKKSKIISIDYLKEDMEIKANDIFEEELDFDFNFNRLLECLNCKERLVTILYYKNNYNVKEITKILKLKENTVKSLLKRSRDKIKSNYKEEMYGI